MALPTGARLGSYEILSLLGRGGIGEVYLAEDTRLNRKVALKVLSAESVTDERAKSRLWHGFASGPDRSIPAKSRL
ncbi:MAG: hypothetical protein ACRD3C_06720 [Vicinamibacterales bacterium]